MPGEAHLVVTTSCALDGHVELVAYSQVLLLQEDLQREQRKERRSGPEGTLRAIHVPSGGDHVRVSYLPAPPLFSSHADRCKNMDSYFHSPLCRGSGGLVLLCWMQKESGGVALCGAAPVAVWSGIFYRRALRQNISCLTLTHGPAEKLVVEPI